MCPYDLSIFHISYSYIFKKLTQKIEGVFLMKKINLAWEIKPKQNPHLHVGKQRRLNKIHSCTSGKA